MNQIAVMSPQDIELLIEKVVYKTIKKASQSAPQLEHMSEEEAARYLGVSPATLCTWRCRMKGPRYTKVGKRVIYKMHDLEEYAATKQKGTLDQLPR